MTLLQFESVLDRNGQIVTPAEIAQQIPAGTDLRVVVSWNASVDDADWSGAGLEQFAAAYADEDSIYEQLL